MTGLCHFEVVFCCVLNNTTQWLHFIKKLIFTPSIIRLTKPLLNFKVSHRYQTHRAQVIDFQMVKKELYVGNATHIFVWVTYVFPGWQFCFWWFVASILFLFCFQFFPWLNGLILTTGKQTFFLNPTSLVYTLEMIVPVLLSFVCPDLMR